MLATLPPERHYDLAKSISKYTGLTFSAEDWTNRELYKGHGINFKKLELHLPNYIDHLTILDPSQDNEQELREWANNNISWLKELFGSTNKIIDESRSSGALFQFDFTPNSWIKEYLKLSSEELKLKKERADIALNKEIESHGALVNATSSTPEEKELEFSTNMNKSSSSSNGVAAKTIEQHLEEARNKAMKGHGAEKQRALVYAKEIFDTFSAEKQELFFFYVKKNIRGLTYL
ncbi:hypothetical protein ACLKMH_14735 [Psychromonas sp. KJ10-10]|uniref:hypothetical protein n=1 Tax=Psychromonas sp. KJ10-10 TaxID=3391823 RepID=UPI0039B445D9